MDIQQHLQHTRNSLSDIARRTANLGDDPDIAAIEAVLKERDAIICDMKKGAAELDAADRDWTRKSDADAATRALFEENASLLRLVEEMDGRLARILETKKAGIKKRLSFAYAASRATSAYIVHNVFRTAQ